MNAPDQNGMRSEYDFSHAKPNPYSERLAGKSISTPTTRGEQSTTTGQPTQISKGSQNSHQRP
ncbi:hypothetical protein HED60_21190 [Planctomycetales bacterium ZRK34]|nr:hypothetical protein HED60_21190 [Planctomycetales bacterium ZRK34]